jgi:hypothetical protein
MDPEDLSHHSVSCISTYLILGLSKVWRVGTHWMHNLIMHPTSSYT